LVGKNLVYRLLIVSNDQARAERIAEEFFDHDAYIVLPVAVEQLGSLENDRDGCVVV
jgi:hypothetical protein